MGNKKHIDVKISELILLRKIKKQLGADSYSQTIKLLTEIIQENNINLLTYNQYQQEQEE